MIDRLRGFACSWFFAPYLGSADLDFFKRLKDTPVDYQVVQVKRADGDERLWRYVTQARFVRVEVETDHRNPRSRQARDDFMAAVLAAFRTGGDRCDFIVSHSNEVPSHAAAAELKRRVPRIPWVAYFGDLIAANPYIRLMPGYPLRVEDEETEARTLELADLIILNNEYQRRLMFQGRFARQAHKAVVIPHCFDPAMYPAQSQTQNEKFTFMHLGTLYSLRRTAEPLLLAVDRLLQLYPAYAGRFEVRFVGTVGEGDLLAHARMRHRGAVQFQETVPYLESLRQMQQADALVLIDGIFSPKEDAVPFNPFFPCKLTDYMGAHKPILAITMSEGPAADIIRASGNVLADARIDRIAFALKRCLDGRVQPDPRAYEPYHCQRVAAQMEEAFRRVVAARPARAKAS